MVLISPLAWPSTPGLAAHSESARRKPCRFSAACCHANTVPRTVQSGPLTQLYRRPALSAPNLPMTKIPSPCTLISGNKQSAGRTPGFRGLFALSALSSKHSLVRLPQPRAQQSCTCSGVLPTRLGRLCTGFSTASAASSSATHRIHHERSQGVDQALQQAVHQALDGLLARTAVQETSFAHRVLTKPFSRPSTRFSTASSPPVRPRNCTSTQPPSARNTAARSASANAVMSCRCHRALFLRVLGL